MNDTDIIRAVRKLCLQHKFDEATRLAKTLEDQSSRNTLVLICKSFEQSQIRVRVA